jgi:signal transduction histidine kinase
MLAGSIILGIYHFQLNRRLALAETQRLRELDEIKTRLYTNITHEFRTPLTVIQGPADASAKRTSSALRTGDFDIIQRNSQHLLDLINRMLDLSELDAGQLDLHPVQGDILPFLRYVTESFHSFALNQKINLNFYSDAEEIVMDYDPEKVLQVLSNLLSNALKFTPEYGKVQVKALTGHTPVQGIHAIRLQHARHLLQTTDLRVGEVVGRVGFKEHSYFTKLYKEAFGELPSESVNKREG